MLRSTQSFACYGFRCSPSTCLPAALASVSFWFLLVRVRVVRVPARATAGAKPKDPARRARPSAPLKLSTTRAPCCVRRAQCVFGGDPDRPLTFGKPSPRVDPRGSAREFHVLCSGPRQSSDAKIARGEGRDSKVGLFTS
jgi:hypothetical protein